MGQLYAGLDVALESTSVCVVDGDGKPILETKVPSDPEAIAMALKRCDGEFERVGFEAGPL